MGRQVMMSATPCRGRQRQRLCHGIQRCHLERPGGTAPLHAHSGGTYDIFVLKLNSSGAYQWHTFYGSASNDDGHALAVDTGGNVYVTGESDATWNGPAGQAPLHAYSGD